MRTCLALAGAGLIALGSMGMASAAPSVRVGVDLAAGVAALDLRAAPEIRCHAPGHRRHGQ